MQVLNSGACSVGVRACIADAGIGKQRLVGEADAVSMWSGIPVPVEVLCDHSTVFDLPEWKAYWKWRQRADRIVSCLHSCCSSEGDWGRVVGCEVSLLHMGDQVRQIGLFPGPPVQCLLQDVLYEEVASTPADDGSNVFAPVHPCMTSYSINPAQTARFQPAHLIHHPSQVVVQLL